jgi:mono/diheme cytochrome c family protein
MPPRRVRRRRVFRRLALPPILALAAAFSAPAQDDRAAAAAIVARSCAACHRPPKPKGDLDLSAFATGDGDLDAATWRSLRERVAAGDMPPQGATTPAPTRAERDALLRYAEGRIAAASTAPIDPGRVGVRRLSRREYAASIRDVFGVAVRPDEELPQDDLAFGFDNVADALRLPPHVFERYLRIAERVAEEAISVETSSIRPVATFEGEAMDCDLKPSTARGFRVLYSNAALTTRFRAPRTGVYRLSARVAGDHAGDEKPKFAFLVDGRRVETIEVSATRAKPETHVVEARLEKGSRVVGVAFLNDYFDPDHPDRARRDRNLAVDRFEVEGPIDRVDPPPFHREFFKNDDRRASPRRRAEKLLEPFLLRLWRRPAEAADVERLARLAVRSAEELGIFENGMRAAVAAAATSPRFLFRVERDGSDAPPIRPLDGFETASRLSFFLWAAPPDDRLLALARKGPIEGASLRAEAERMLDDPRASSLAEVFAPQWLETRGLMEAAPDPTLFPDFDDSLRRALAREVELLFDAVLRERRPVRDLVDPGFTFVDERLARHYGIVGVFGPEFRRVLTVGLPRGGVLLAGGPLLSTSNPTRTSPVKRGKWALDALLDAPPPPPPPGVGAFPDGADASKPSTLRDLMAKHRADAACASCHARMDALGLALENFDAVGAYRTRHDQTLIDATGTLPDGSTLRGAEDLRAYVRDDPAFTRGLTKKLLIYALGRGPTDDDARAVDALVASFPNDGPKLRDVVLGVVSLDAFRLRRTTPQGR